MTDYYFWLGCESENLGAQYPMRLVFLESSLDRFDMVAGYYQTESQQEQKNDD